jgi:hypothetical protein
MVEQRAGDRGNPLVTLVGLGMVHVECTTSPPITCLQIELSTCG